MEMHGSLMTFNPGNPRPYCRCNVFGPEDTQNILQTPQFVPADLLMELLSSSLVKQKDNPNTIGGTGKHKGKRFDVATSEVQVNTSSSGQLVEQPQLSNYPKTGKTFLDLF